MKLPGQEFESPHLHFTTLKLREAGFNRRDIL
jgi:hypothetical protein